MMNDENRWIERIVERIDKNTLDINDIMLFKELSNFKCEIYLR